MTIYVRAQIRTSGGQELNEGDLRTWCVPITPGLIRDIAVAARTYRKAAALDASRVTTEHVRIAALDVVRPEDPARIALSPHVNLPDQLAALTLARFVDEYGGVGPFAELDEVAIAAVLLAIDAYLKDPPNRTRTQGWDPGWEPV